MMTRASAPRDAIIGPFGEDDARQHFARRLDAFGIEGDDPAPAACKAGTIVRLGALRMSSVFGLKVRPRTATACPRSSRRRR